MCCFTHSYSQEGNKEERLNIDMYTNENCNLEMVGFFRFDYLITSKYAIGGYFGYESDSGKLPLGDRSTFNFKQYSFGLSNKYYLLGSNVRLRPYLAALLGINKEKNNSYLSSNDSYYNSDKSSFDYGAYAGVQFRVIKRVKLMFEIGYGENSTTNFGISIDL